MRQKISGSLVVLILSVGLIGCETSAPTAVPPVTPPGGVDNSSVKLTEIDVAGFERAVASHPGKVVLVDFWATWCGPCVRAFPGTVALSRKFADKPFVVMSVSVDEPDATPEVKAFLAEQQAQFDHYQYAGEGDAFDAFGITDGIPEIRIYDQTGKLVAKWNGANEVEIEAKIQELLQ